MCLGFFPVSETGWHKHWVHFRSQKVVECFTCKCVVACSGLWDFKLAAKMLNTFSTILQILDNNHQFFVISSASCRFWMTLLNGTGLSRYHFRGKASFSTIKYRVDIMWPGRGTGAGILSVVLRVLSLRTHDLSYLLLQHQNTKICILHPRARRIIL